MEETSAWIERFIALAGTEDDKWEAEHDLLREDWLTAYTGVFVQIALARGWRTEDAMTWPVGIGDEAFSEAYRYDWCPRRSAEADVISCEEPP